MLSLSEGDNLFTYIQENDLNPNDLAEIIVKKLLSLAKISHKKLSVWMF